MPLLLEVAINFYSQFGLSDKEGANKVLVDCNSWDLEPLDPLNGLALCCYQPSPGV